MNSLTQYFGDIIDTKRIGEGLQSVLVKRISLSEDNKHMLLYLCLSDKIPPSNSLAPFIYKLSSKFGIKIDCSFVDINQELITGENGCEWLSDYLFNYFIYGNLDTYDGDKDFYRQFCNEVKITPDLLQREVSFVCNNSLKSHPSANIDFVTEKVLAIMSLLFNVDLKMGQIVFDEENKIQNHCRYASLEYDTLDKEQIKSFDFTDDNIGDNASLSTKSTKVTTNSDLSDDKDIDEGSWLGKSIRQKEINKQKNQGFKRNMGPSKSEGAVIGFFDDTVDTVSIAELTAGTKVNIKGKIIISNEGRLNQKGTCVIYRFFVLDETGGISAIAFPLVKDGIADDFASTFTGKGSKNYALFQGTVSYDSDEPMFKVDAIILVDKPEKRKDTAEKKRVELHVHTIFSENDALIKPGALISTAHSFGHRACAVTDHGVVQSYPHIYNESKKLTVKDSDEPFKPILGCEGYLADDGPTIIYNIPFDDDKKRALASIVVLSIKLKGDADINTSDPLNTLIESVMASKYIVKDYVGIKPLVEGETAEEAQEFSKVDIDTSLWNEEEIPENLRNLEGSFVLDLKDDVVRIANCDGSIDFLYSEDDQEVIPDKIVFEHVADFYCLTEDGIYGGTGEPFQSYFDMGRLQEFIGQSYLCGDNIFKQLAFIRRAGFGINIEDHKYYRFKFNMPVIDITSILEFKNQELYDEYCENIDNLPSDVLTSITVENDITSNANQRFEQIKGLIFDKDKTDILNHDYQKMTKVMQFIINFIVKEDTLNPVKINADIGHKTNAEIIQRKNKYKHIVLLARDELGKYNLYRLVSESHVHYFGMRPRMPKSLIKYFHSSIIVGAACEQGEIYQYLVKEYQNQACDYDKTKLAICSSPEFRKILKLYDYIEIQPLTNNSFMTRINSKGEYPLGYKVTIDDLKKFNVMLSEIADYFKMPCCATTDAHFLEPQDAMYRKNLLTAIGFTDSEQAELYFRTTDEMLEEFSYLGDKKAHEVVVDNTNMIADMINYGIKAFPDGTYPPIIPTAARDVINIAWTRANRLYRHKGKLNEVIKARLDKELNSIIGNGFGIMYYIAYRLVKKSNRDGYIVGSRGSVGSSFVATMCGISEVNPLAPHYRCPKCCNVIFDNSGEYGSGYDLPPMNCPECGEEMIRDGQDIPFETFLGFYGDKQPDIDLNFSGEYQPNAHKYVEYLFGLSNTFRAGTITAYQDKEIIGVARKIEELKETKYSNATRFYMTQGILGVRKSTGQHPGGIVVIPKEMEIYEFTPVQFPANKTQCGIITTHYTFKEMHDTILKLDILGHDDPTVLRMLNSVTGKKPDSIPIPDTKVMQILETTEVLGFPVDKTDAGAATLGLPEVGTEFAREMIKETKPKHFYDIVQLMGLSHGTDVWMGNAQELIRKGICDLNSVIGCRDSIMTRLIYWGLPNKESFDIMEKVRKGKGLSPEHEQLMLDNNVPEWYIGSCKKIKYMFPKAHAAAYTISLMRIAWFKVYYPEEYYCAYFSIRGDEFDADDMCCGMPTLVDNRKEYQRAKQDDPKNPKTKAKFYLIELIEEMYARGIEFVPIDLMKSEATRFVKVADKKILPPLNAISSISDAIATSIVEARNDGPFMNKEEIMSRCGVGKATIKRLTEYGLLYGMPESNQVDIFDLLGQ